MSPKFIIDDVYLAKIFDGYPILEELVDTYADRGNSLYLADISVSDLFADTDPSCIYLVSQLPLDDFAREVGTVFRQSSRDDQNQQIIFTYRNSHRTTMQISYTPLEDDKQETFIEYLSNNVWTVNAVGIDLTTGDIIDPFGGVEDITNGLIRTTPNGQALIADNPDLIWDAHYLSQSRHWKLDEQLAAR